MISYKTKVTWKQGYPDASFASICIEYALTKFKSDKNQHKYTEYDFLNLQLGQLRILNVLHCVSVSDTGCGTQQFFKGLQASLLLDLPFRRLNKHQYFCSRLAQGSFAIPIIELILPTIHSILSWRWLSVVQLASL